VVSEHDRESRELDQRRSDAYRRLRSTVDEDALHDLIARLGPEILDRDFPYLIVAARHRQLDTWRSQARRVHREERSQRATIAGSALDPLEAAIADESLAELLIALSTLDERDSWLLWWAAQGHGAADLKHLWELAGFRPAGPSGAMLRQRLHRARQALASRLPSIDESV
jgi:hypothetical protein